MTKFPFIFAGSKFVYPLVLSGSCSNGSKLCSTSIRYFFFTNSTSRGQYCYIKYWKWQKASIIFSRRNMGNLSWGMRNRILLLFCLMSYYNNLPFRLTKIKLSNIQVFFFLFKYFLYIWIHLDISLALIFLAKSWER